MGAETKRCNVCGIEKGHAEFYPDRRARDGRQCKCRDCAKRKAAEWQKQNLERHKWAQRRYKPLVKREVMKVDDLPDLLPHDWDPSGAIEWLRTRSKNWYQLELQPGGSEKTDTLNRLIARIVKD